MSGKSVITYQISSRDEFDRLLKLSESGIPFITAEWSESLQDIFGYKADLLLLYYYNEPVALATIYYRIKGGVKFALHPSLTPYNPVVFIPDTRLNPVSARERKSKILSYIGEQIKQIYKYPVFYNDLDLVDIRPLMWENWENFPSYTYLLNLSDYTVDSDISRRSRKCANEGYTISDEWNPRVFWDLFSLTMDRQGFSIPLDIRKFEKLVERVYISGMAWMMTAYDSSGKAHASWIQFSSDGSRLYNWNAASHPDHLNSGATSFLVLKMLEKIKSLGYKDWDLCGADNPGVARFKGNLGGELRLYFRSVFTRYDKIQKLKLKIKRTLP